MLQIIRTEWLKVRSYRTFWVLLLLAVLSIPAANFIVAEITETIREQAQNKIPVNLYDFPIIWQSVSWINSFMTAVFGFPLLILVTNEFTYKTHRQNIIDGWERRDFVLAKLYWWLAFGVLALLTTMLTGTLLGLAYALHPFSFEDSRFLFYYFLQVEVSMGIALLIAVLVRRAGLAIVLYLAYIMLVDQLLVLIVKRKVGEIGGLLPMQAADELIPFPIIDKFIPDTNRYDDSVYLIMLLVYIALMIFLVFRRMLKTDY
ncbi:ABC transporter permease [uncultured Chitinophaga sp.]|jgi:hypothetical protein|uniref:ABC transporter permease n=1 Tax=uncultured Chitinophaga sp. TaxID=339340 RepID=UPI00260B57C5|nr:ABC transporter permease [uncultured Chitinophaga sp.]